MNETEFEKQLFSIAKEMDYPRTPDIAGFVTTRLRSSARPRLTLHTRPLTWSLTIVLILALSLLLIPPARAAILEFIQIGIVRIFPRPVEPTMEVIRTAIPVTATPSEPLLSLPDLLESIAGETTLELAGQQVSYPILLPAKLSKPDHVFIQDANGNMTILVWVDPQQPEKVTMSLHFIPQGSWAIEKVQPVIIEETEVNGNRAIWAVGPYPLRFSNGDMDFVRLIDGHVLIWEDGFVTYRLETDLPLEEAIKIAESLQPIP